MPADLKIDVVGGLGRHGGRYVQHLDRGDIEGMRIRLIHPRGILPGNLRGADGVIIACSPDAHWYWVGAAIQERVPALVEKPIVLPGQSLVLGVAKGLIHPAHTLRYNGGLLAARDYWKGGMALKFESRIPHESRFRHGVLLDHAVHYFDAIRFITGRFLLPRFCYTNVVESGMERYALIAGTAGRAPVVVEVTETDGDRAQLLTVSGPVRGRTFDLLASSGHTLPAILVDFRDALRGRREFPISLEEGLAVVRTAEDCRRLAWHSASHKRELSSQNPFEVARMTTPSRLMRWMRSLLP